MSNGLPAGTAYKASGEIDPKIKESPPKDIVNKIRNTIESPSRVKSPPKPRCKYKIRVLMSYTITQALVVSSAGPYCNLIDGLKIITNEQPSYFLKITK